MTIYSRQLFLVILVALSINSPAQTFSSSNQRVNILELYTSEGCSSCPPADRWLSQLKQDKRLWKELIPMAFHVDYWDYIGWKDRFALPQYSQRQRLYARQNRLSTVYTPGMLLNGKEWRSWFYFKPLRFDNSPPAGKLTVSLKDKLLTANYNPPSKNNKKYILNIAILGFDLSSQIKAGENRGRHLKHDFVVLGHRMIKMQNQLSSKLSSHYTNKVQLPQVNIKANRQAIAVWVNEESHLNPIQAVGGWIEL